LERTAVVYIHHALRSSSPLLHAILQLGLSPQNTFILDKHYSECDAVVKEIRALGVHYQPCSAQIGLGKFSHSFMSDINYLWYRVIEELKDKKGKEVDNLIIMDHGGHALAFTPAELLKGLNVLGIEKTTGGLINPDTQGLPFPIIETASCAAKRFLESPFIAEAVVDKITPLIPIRTQNLTCGVVGYGAIGKAVTNKLISMGHKVIVHDNDPNQLKNIKGVLSTNELSSVIAFADYIFGCSGRDIATSIDFFRICPRDKTLISCSSEDKEFLSILQMIQRKYNGKVASKPLHDVLYTNDFGAKIRILRGGFPVNFDHSGESVPANKIQLTRALIYVSVIQAIQFFKKPHLFIQGDNYMLDPKLQEIVVEEFLKVESFDASLEKLVKKFKNKDTEWIMENSGSGKYEPYDYEKVDHRQEFSQALGM
jgi:S-adenosylhomocysteine hydrolase